LFNKNHIYFEDIDSTNEFALSLRRMPLFKEGLIITTDYQSQGKGQEGNKWYSKKGLNILLSIVIEPRISLNKQFDISKLVSLSCYNFLLCLGLSPRIKWPNDILINNKKIAGVLIQNIVSNDTISYSVIGIGINVNQHNFPEFTPSATSLSLELKKQQNCVYLRDKFLENLGNYLIDYRKGCDLDVVYHQALFLKDKMANFQQANQKFKGIIRRVSLNGILEIEVNKSIKEFKTQEIKFIF